MMCRPGNISAAQHFIVGGILTHISPSTNIVIITCDLKTRIATLIKMWLINRHYSQLKKKKTDVVVDHDAAIVFSPNEPYMHLFGQDS